jgi:hypothetical protein
LCEREDCRQDKTLEVPYCEKINDWLI